MADWVRGCWSSYQLSCSVARQWPSKLAVTESKHETNRMNDSQGGFNNYQVSRKRRRVEIWCNMEVDRPACKTEADGWLHWCSKWKGQAHHPNVLHGGALPHVT